MQWWGWVVVGALLLSSELFVPTDFFLVFLGVAALIVGGVGLAGLEAPIWGQWLLFGALCLLLLLAVRGPMKRRQAVSDPRVDDTLVGEIALIHQHLDAGATGVAELRGSQWTARNLGPSPLAPGARARVERVEGLVLHLRREH